MLVRRLPIRFFQLTGQVFVDGKQVELLQTAQPGYKRPNIEFYKPSQQIELDEKGECLIYSNDVLNGVRVWTHSSSIFPLAGIPASALLWALDPLKLSFLNAFWAFPLMLAFTMPHMNHIYNLRYRITKIWFLRANGFIKLETALIDGTKQTVYTEIKNLQNKLPHRGKFQEFLTPNGVLRSDINFQAQDWKDFMFPMNDVNVVIPKEGKVHDPELLTALLRGYEIDFSDHRINKRPFNNLQSDKCIGGSIKPLSPHFKA